MVPFQRMRLSIVTCGLLAATPAVGQPMAPPAGQPQPPLASAPQPPAAQPAAPSPPPGFQLDALHQAYLDQVLDAWQLKSGQINTFKCSFERQEFNVAFGPAQSIPLFVSQGELSFVRPDKGSFRITEIKKWQAVAAAPNQQQPAPVAGQHVVEPNAVGEHWVCDGKSIFEYRHEQKQLIERPIPPELQGQGIVDGPLPFLFGAEAAKLKKRYWLRIVSQPNQPDQIWLEARPKYQADAADYRSVDVMLDRNRVLPTAMNIVLPDGSRHLYLFDLEKAAINSKWEQFIGWFKPPELLPGWKRIVEPMPGGQAAAPATMPR